MTTMYLNTKMRVREHLRRHIINNGDGTTLKGLNKRPHPGACEMCGRVLIKLDYHHWNPDNPSLGVWLCIPCHMCAEGIDDGLCEKYITLKGEVVSVGPDIDYSTLYNACPYCSYDWGANAHMPKYCPRCHMTLWQLSQTDEEIIEEDDKKFFESLRNKVGRIE